MSRNDQHYAFWLKLNVAQNFQAVVRLMLLCVRQENYINTLSQRIKSYESLFLLYESQKFKMYVYIRVTFIACFLLRTFFSNTLTWLTFIKLIVSEIN